MIPSFPKEKQASDTRDNFGDNQDFNVICAKGSFAFNHSGNKRFRKIVSEHLQQYANASNKSEKSKVVTAIIEHVQARGNFVKQDTKTKAFVPISDRFTREKVGQGLRDALHFKYKSSQKSKKRQRLAECREREDLINNIVSIDKRITATIPNVINQVPAVQSDNQLMRMLVDADIYILNQPKDSECETSLTAAIGKEEDPDAVPLNEVKEMDTAAIGKEEAPDAVPLNEVKEMDICKPLFDDDEFYSILQSLLPSQSDASS